MDKLTIQKFKNLFEKEKNRLLAAQILVAGTFNMEKDDLIDARFQKTQFRIGHTSSSSQIKRLAL